MKLELEDLVEAYTIGKNGLFIKVLEYTDEFAALLEMELDKLKEIEFMFKEFESITEARKLFNKIKKLHPDLTWTALIKKGKIIETYTY